MPDKSPPFRVSVIQTRTDHIFVRQISGHQDLVQMNISTQVGWAVILMKIILIILKDIPTVNTKLHLL